VTAFEVMPRKRLRSADREGEDDAVAAGSNGKDDAVVAGRDISGANSEGASEGASDAEDSGSCGAEASRSTHSSACARSDAAVIRGCCMYLPLSSPSASAELMQVSSLASRHADFLCAFSGWMPLTDPACLGRPLRERRKRMLAPRRRCVSVNYFYHLRISTIQ
jgi:hypothetical protein